MYYLTLLRHGRSLADDEKKCEGRYDSPLTQVGESQAAATANLFRNAGFEFDKILTSPLIRAKRTADIINNLYKVPILVDPVFMEHDNGIIAGMLKTELNEKYPLPAFDSPFRYFPEKTGENCVQEHARAGLAMNRLIDLGPGKYLLVTHGGIGNAIIRNILGVGPMVNGSGFSVRLKDNGWVQFGYREDKHHWQLLGMG